MQQKNQSKRFRAASLIACVLFAAVVLPANHLAAQSLDNLGDDFIMGFMPNYSGAATVALHLTAAVSTNVTVQYPVNSPTFDTTVAVGPGAVTIVDVPVAAASAWTLDAPTNNAVRAFTTNNSEFVCYMINLQQYTSDASLALPVDTMNTRYIVTTHPSYSEEFVVVAAFDNTTATITYPGQAPFDVVLNRGEGYLHQGTGLTGTLIDADRPVGMTNVNVCVAYDGSACDHIFEVGVPVQAWGTFIPIANIPETDLGVRYSIVASEDNTAVTLDGAALVTLNATQSLHTDRLPGDHIIQGDKPIFVSQFMANRGSSGGDPIGDPALGNMSPAPQYSSNYTFSTVGGAQFAEHAMSIVAENAVVAALTLDGAVVGAGNFTAIPGSSYSVARLILTEGVHNTASPGGHHAIMVMGFNAYDSYLYTGGALFQFINPAGDPYAPVCNCSLQGGMQYGCTATENKTEDDNSNGVLDPGEDDNANGELDEDTGVFFVKLLDGATNLALTVIPFTPGDASVAYHVDRIDPNLDGTGIVRVTDGAGNNCDNNIRFITGSDCNGNFVSDADDIAAGTSQDCNSNGIPDECDINSGAAQDCNTNGIPDSCDIAAGASQDANSDGVPDECAEPPPGSQPLPPPRGLICIPFLFQSLFGIPLCGPCFIVGFFSTMVGIAGMKYRRRRGARGSRRRNGR